MDVYEKIKLFLLDMDGTVYLGNKLINGSVKAIERMRTSGRQICFLTNNSSKSLVDYAAKLHGMGIPVSEQEIYTSGLATIEHLNTFYSGAPVYLVGTDSLKEEFCRGGIPLTEHEPEIVVLGYDTTLTYGKLVKLTKCVKKGVRFIATHPDVNCPADDVYVPDVGSFLALVEASTGIKPSAILGKPYRYMAESIMRRFGLEASEIAMVGDRLSTDMAFAINSGFLSVLVLSGETDRAAYEKSGFQVDAVIESIDRILK